MIGKPSRMKRTVILMTAATFTGQFLGLARESVIAAKYGATGLTDAFLLAVLIPNAVLLLLQNGFVLAFIPVLTQAFTVEGAERGWELAFGALSWVLLVTGLLAAVIALTADPIVTLLAPTVPPDTHMLIVRMLRILVLVVVLGGVSAILVGRLNVHRTYTVPTLLGLVLNLTVIGGVLLFADRISIYALAIATVISYAFQVILLAFFLRVTPGYRFKLALRDPALQQILLLAWPAIFTLFLQQTIVFADRSIASRLGSGNVAALNFAAKLVLVLAPLLYGALAAITLPEASRIVAAGDWVRARSLAGRLLRFMFFASIPAAVLVIVLRRPITILVFQRGAFDTVATNLTAGAMGFYAIVLAAAGLREITVRLLYASHETLIPMWSGSMRMGVNLLLNVVLARSMGINGIALASAVAIMLDTVVLLGALAWKWGLGVSLIYPLKILVASGLMFVASFLVLGLIEGQSFDPTFLERV